MRSLAERKQNALHVSRPNASPAPVQPEATAPTQLERPEVDTKPRESTAITALVSHLRNLGVDKAYGVSGGAIALLFDALAESDMSLCHFRHETGAAFAACEASLASNEPVVVFATTGPGLLNVLTGITAAKWDGAKVILVSGATSHPQRGRWATQETSSYTLPQDALYGKSALFDYAVRMEHVAELPEVCRRLAQGVGRPGAFVAHVCVPMGVQAGRVEEGVAARILRQSVPTVAEDEMDEIARRLKSGSFAIWAGFGATHSAAKVRELAERAGVPVICSPRAKGVMPERHPLYLGVSGLGGHEAVNEHMRLRKPDHVLVLGSRLGEPTSFWDRDLCPDKAFVHVDLDPEVPGTAFPDMPTLAVQAEVGRFLDALLEHFPERRDNVVAIDRGLEEPVQLPEASRRPVRPQVLMAAIQRRIVQGSDAVILAECGNSFAWCNHHLRFPDAGRYRVSTLFGSMGHAAAGVVGTALARGGKAVAVVGDGSMLMNSEISTAAEYGAQAVWIVLNDSGYGMCRDGHRALGLTDRGVDFQRTVDFSLMARAVGAEGRVVETEDQLELALADAMAAEGPYVLDVRIDASEASPLLQRFESLIKQGNSKNVAGWEAREDD